MLRNIYLTPKVLHGKLLQEVILQECESLRHITLQSVSTLYFRCLSPLHFSLVDCQLYESNNGFDEYAEKLSFTHLHWHFDVILSTFEALPRSALFIYCKYYQNWINKQKRKFSHSNNSNPFTMFCDYKNDIHMHIYICERIYRC